MKKQVLVIRRDIKLSLGKWLSQAVHAAQRTNVHTDYENEKYICIVAYCKSEIKLMNLYQKCLDNDVACGLQRDAGHSEVDPNTPTALCVGPDDPEKVDAITKRLQLVKIEIDEPKKVKKYPVKITKHPVKIENLFINKKIWNTFDDIEMEKYAKSVFNYYRIVGFPFFPTDAKYRANELRRLNNYDFTKTIDIENCIINQSMHGLALAWSYMPHSWEVVCNDKRTPWEIFHDDDLLLNCIKKRIKIGDNMSDNGLRKMMKLFSGAQSVSNYRPTAAASLYVTFCEPNDVVWDMSCGFGGRLLGSYLAKVKYIGTDPSTPTFDGLQEMNKELKLEAELHKCGSEEFLPEKDSLDFCFTSPPYFNLEKYTNEETQSYVKFPDKKKWIDGFLKKTFENCYYGLKEGKTMAINVSNTRIFNNFEEETIRCALEVGFELKSTWRLALSNPAMSNAKSHLKYEPIFIFRK